MGPQRRTPQARPHCRLASESHHCSGRTNVGDHYWEQQERKEKTKEVTYSLTPPFPKEILIDISSLCNHACNFCSNVKMTNKSHASSEMVYRVLKEAKEAGSEAVGLYATGEPFLNKDLENFIKYAKEINYSYVFVTT